MSDIIDISVCGDCLQYLANGPDSLEPHRVAEIEVAIQREGSAVVPNCDEDCEGDFSWSPCELCRYTLGGDRHKAAVWIED